MKIIKFAVAFLLLTGTNAMSQEDRYNPVPEYDPNNSYTIVDKEYPRAVFSLTNKELENRFEALGSFNSRSERSHASTEKMNNLQRIYDSWLRFFIEGNEEDHKSSEGALEETLSQLEWVVETDPVVEQGFPLRLTVKLRNASDHDVEIHDPYSLGSFFFISSIRLEKKDSPEPRVIVRKQALFLYFRMPDTPPESSDKTITLAPGESQALGSRGGGFDVAGHYDIFEPGEYELTFYTRQFCDKDGKAAENEVRSYPAPSSIRFKVIPKQSHEAKVAPLEFHYENPSEADREISEPAPTRMPSNAEIAARFKALAEAKQSSDPYYRKFLPRMKDSYETCLDLLVEKMGTANPAARTEKFAGLKWRALLPSVNKPGEPIILQLGLENISDNEYYNILKRDAMHASAVLASIRIHKCNDVGEWEEVPLTSSGAWLLYNFGQGAVRTVRFFSGGSLPPGMLRMTVQPGGAFGSRDFDLTKYWDLSQTGSYRLTFYTRRFLDKDGNPAEDQVRPFPESDTVYFGIMKY